MKTPILILLCLLATGCQMEPNDVQPYSKDQLRRGDIIEEFSNNPSGAIAKYRSLWHERTSDTPPSPIVLLALAGELLEHDHANYAEYYSYITSQLSVSDAEIVAYAISALSRAHGQQSINLLLKYADDDRSYISREAMTALNYRLATAMYDPELANDQALITSHLPMLCGHEFNEEIAQFCDGSL